MKPRGLPLPAPDAHCFVRRPPGAARILASGRWCTTSPRRRPTPSPRRALLSPPLPPRQNGASMPCTRRYFDQAYYDGLSDEDKETFYKCIKTGFDNADSGMGCYAMTPTDYTTFAPFFAKAIGDYHKGDPACAEKHENDWDISGVGEGGVLDLQKLGLAEELSMRVRVGRNLTSFPLPGAMTKEDRIKFEVTMAGSFDALKEKFGGTVYSYSPDLGEGVEHPNKIDEEKYNELVAAHVMFKDMAADPYLASAGIASDWPYGRGCWQSEDKKKIVWFGEEDQLRIMVMKKGFLLNEVFNELKELLRCGRVHRGRRLREGRHVRLRHVVPDEPRHGHARVRPRQDPEPHGRRHGRQGQGDRRASGSVGPRHGRRAHADRRGRHRRHLALGAALHQGVRHRPGPLRRPQTPPRRREGSRAGRGLGTRARSSHRYRVASLPNPRP